MKMGNLAGRLGLLAVALSVSAAAYGQAEVTASQAMELSVFGAGTGTFTSLENTRNAGVTAGLDLAFRPFFGVRPAFEIRGTYPFDKGEVVGLKDGLVGIRLQKTYGRFEPYLDGHWGRGEITYVGGFIIGNYRYDRTTSNILAGGGGFDFRLTDHFGIKADAQVQRWSTPVTQTGHLYPVPVSLGVTYHFDFNHHAKIWKERPVREPAPQPFFAPSQPPAAEVAPPPPPTTPVPDTAPPPPATTGTSTPPPNN